MEKYLDMKNEVKLNELQKVASIIKNDGIVLFPTETVYGIGANGLSTKAVERIYKAKGRSTKNPINLLVSDIKMIKSVAKDITELEYKLIETFFPGPLTIILKKKDIVPDIVTAGGDTVGVRMPSGKIALKLVQEAGVPIAAPSANLSGSLSGTNLNDIIGDFKDKVDCIIDGGDSKIGLESTIVKVVDGVPHILRPGAITDAQIEESAGDVVLDYSNKQDNNLLPSNDMAHYKIRNRCILVGAGNKQVDDVKRILDEFDDVVVICCNENACKYNAKVVLNVGNKGVLEEVSRNIFRLLREADRLNPDVIVVEGVEEKRNR